MGKDALPERREHSRLYIFFSGLEWGEPSTRESSLAGYDGPDQMRQSAEEPRGWGKMGKVGKVTSGLWLSQKDTDLGWPPGPSSYLHGDERNTISGVWPSRVRVRVPLPPLRIHKQSSILSSVSYHNPRNENPADVTHLATWNRTIVVCTYDRPVFQTQTTRSLNFNFPSEERRCKARVAWQLSAPRAGLVTKESLLLGVCSRPRAPTAVWARNR